MQEEELDLSLALADQVDALVTVVRCVRDAGRITKPELGRLTGLGRSVVTQRLEQAMRLGFIREGELAPSTGGRAPRLLQFDALAGQVLVAVFGASHASVGVADLAGTIQRSVRVDWDITRGPAVTMQFLFETFDKMIVQTQSPIWGIGIGVPGPVEFETGRPVAPPIMPGWNNFDIRGAVEARLHAPVWVDNDVNLMAVGEYTEAERAQKRDVIYVKVGTGIGAGIISEGHVHRGANGSAGDVGHILVPDHASEVCRCGRLGCLEAVAGGWALARDAMERASESSFVQQRMTELGALTPRDIVEGSLNGDALCLELVIRSGRAVGEHVAAMTNFFNPSRVAVGGTVASAGDPFMATIREIVYKRSLPLATRDLIIAPATTDIYEGLRGAATLVTDQLFSDKTLRTWILDGRPGASSADLYASAAA